MRASEDQCKKKMRGWGMRKNKCSPRKQKPALDTCSEAKDINLHTASLDNAAWTRTISLLPQESFNAINPSPQHAPNESDLTEEQWRAIDDIVAQLEYNDELAVDPSDGLMAEQVEYNHHVATPPVAQVTAKHSQYNDRKAAHHIAQLAAERAKSSRKLTDVPSLDQFEMVMSQLPKILDRDMRGE